MLVLIIFIIEFISGFMVLINIFGYLFYNFITKPTTKNYFVLTKLVIIRPGPRLAAGPFCKTKFTHSLSMFQKITNRSLTLLEAEKWGYF
jgi:hypothetical protein